MPRQASLMLHGLSSTVIMIFAALVLTKSAVVPNVAHGRLCLLPCRLPSSQEPLVETEAPSWPLPDNAHVESSEPTADDMETLLVTGTTFPTSAGLVPVY